MMTIRKTNGGERKMKLQVSITESRFCGSGNSFPVGSASSFKEASVLIEMLEARFERWAKNNFPPLHKLDPVGYYEGCDVDATDLEEKTTYFLDGDTWELWD